MKISAFSKFCLPVALLAFLSINASATTCASITGTTLNNFQQSVLSCTIGDLTFSNFAFNYTSGVDTGDPSGTGHINAPSDPNPNTNVTLNFTEITSGTDANGTTASSSDPIYELVTDYSAANSVNEFQNEHYFVSYSVTDNTTGSTVIQVDDNLVGGATNGPMGASATLTDKLMCVGGSFVVNGGQPSATCSAGSRNIYQAVDEADGGLALIGNPDSGEADSSVNYQSPSQNDGIFNGTTGGGETSFGVYDQADFDGGNTNANAIASITSVENDFAVVDPAGTGTPEPATFVLFGGALVALGVVRRKKSA
jgi:hypothetical protein